MGQEALHLAKGRQGKCSREEKGCSSGGSLGGERGCERRDARNGGVMDREVLSQRERGHRGKHHRTLSFRCHNRDHRGDGLSHSQCARSARHDCMCYLTLTTSL